MVLSATTDRPRPSLALAYGRGSISVPLMGRDPLVVVPEDVPPLADPRGEILAALRDPLRCEPIRGLVHDGDRVVISVCDGTRAQPRRVMLPPLLDEIASVAPNAVVTVIIATGTHRANTPDELEEMLGEDVLSRVRVVNHDARDDLALVDLGTYGAGVHLELAKEWVNADVRITTGFVEPHFFAGFSGGPKMVVPGLAGLRTVMTLHDAARIGSPRATWGLVEENPVHEDIRACAAVVPPDLSLDVLLDRKKRITHVFAGELFAMHGRACATALQIAMQEVPQLFDVVVTTGSGYPLDQNLYQAVKGMAAAERIIRPGGTIIIAAECQDGLPAHGSFADVLGAAASSEELLRLIESDGFSVADQWQVQILARILSLARVELYCDGLSPQQVRAAHLEPIPDVAAAVAAAIDRTGPATRVCYLPDGPQTIPYLARSIA